MSQSDSSITVAPPGIDPLTTAPTSSPQPLKSLVYRGSAWVVFGSTANQSLRLAGNLILTRLLFPEAFGLMALANVFLQTLNMFSDLGVQPSIVQSKRGDDRRYLDTAWTLQILRGIVLWIACCALAYPLAVFYEQPRLFWLIPAGGLSAVLSGFTSTKLISAQRHMDLRPVVLIESFATVIGLTAAVCFAWQYRSVWALVMAGLVTATVQMTLSHWVLPGTRNRLSLDRESAKSLIGFGKWIFLNTAIGGLAMHIDRLMLGKLMPIELLGVYAIARNLSLIPDRLIKKLSGGIVFPSMSRMHRESPDQMRQRILVPRRKVLLVSAVVLGAIVSVADLAIGVMYDERYTAARWMAPILLLGIWPAILSGTLDKVFFATGVPAMMLFGTISRLVFLTFGVWVGYQWYGSVGAVVAIALGEAVRYVAIWWPLARLGMLALRQDLVSTAVFLATIVLTWCLRDSVDYLASPIWLNS